MAIDGVGVGRIVHYVSSEHEDKKTAGECHAAIIVKVWNVSEGMVNLEVFPDGTNSGLSETWATSRKYDHNKGPYTWHWPERA